MKLPFWYIIECVLWLFTGLPLYVLIALYAGRLWPIPDLPYEFMPVWQWLLAVAFLYHPLILLPFALVDGRRKAKNAQN